MSKSFVSETRIAGFPALASSNRSAHPPIVFVHGAFATHLPFSGWMETFAHRGWQSVAASLRGRLGMGPERAKDATIADYVEDTLKVVATLDRPPVIVGHSMGGLIAQKIAELGKCRAAVLLAPAPPWMLPAQGAALPALLPMMPKILSGTPLLPSRRGCARIVFNKMPQEQCANIHAGLVHESGKVYREMIFGKIRVDASKVGCPVHVIGASEDRIVSPALCRKIAAYYHGSHKNHDGHGHWFLQEEGWEKIAAQALDWIEANAMKLTPMESAA